MQVGSVTTPFGRRPMTLALVRGQLATADIKPGKSVDKWKVFRDACEARIVLGLTDRALSVLNALLSFYPEQQLSDERGLIVFPSNNQLTVRAHGITGTTLRRHLAALVDAGLIIRKDSPNGKRYAHKDGSGSIKDAFGFSLAPMLARSEELAHMAQQVAADRKALRLTKERLSICLRDVRKLISAAVEEGAAGDWGMIEEHYIGLMVRVPKSPTAADMEPVAEEMEMLREEIINLLEMQVNSEKTDGNAVQNERHIQNSNTESIYESEPRSEKEQGAKSSQAIRVLREPIKAFPLGMVLKACPDIAMYGPGGTVASWRDLMSAAVVVRSMLGVSPSAYEEACVAMTAENAAVAMACILERSSFINSAGGYLRDLTKRAELGGFSLGPMLMALLRANGERSQRAG
ncbi:plasmid replication protein RepC [Rhizobium ruizarguesonis]|uniref:plasmid replication protein RepC n=1 Tax=Rhizobium ruizarguesonis TaxID=2081791 RepID=UPI001030815A|nr:plasmid replication protein RepC [Rhizobium ruizarguesonis]TAV24583.1 replication initiation protein RepC [Rhizobium ruizarguesonis]